MRLPTGSGRPVCGPSARVCVRAGRVGTAGRPAGLRCHVSLPPTLAVPPPPCRARMSAAQCLAHPWLNNLAEKAKRCNRRLKSQILLKKYLMKRRWKVLLGWGWGEGGAARQEGLLARDPRPQIPGPTSPALAGSVDQAWPSLENRAGFSLFVLGWLLALHPEEGRPSGAWAQEKVSDLITGFLPSFYKYLLSLYCFHALGVHQQIKETRISAFVDLLWGGGGVGDNKRVKEGP